MSRKAEYPVEGLFLRRATVRKMSGQPVDPAVLMSLFEAARWAPSSFNGQPWRIIYAQPGDESWQTLFDLLVGSNASWAKDAGALMLICAKKTLLYKGESLANPAASFDTGAACEHMALQAAALGLGFATVGGFDHGRAAQLMPSGDYRPLVMGVVGQPRSAETPPGDRRPVKSFVTRDFNGWEE